MHDLDSMSSGTGCAPSRDVKHADGLTAVAAVSPSATSKTGPSIFPVVSRRAFIAMVQTFDTTMTILTAMLALKLAVYQASSAGPSTLVCVLIALFVSAVIQCVFTALGLYEFVTLMRWRFEMLLAAFAWFIATGPIVIPALMHDPSGAYARRWVLAWFIGGLVTFAGSRPLIALIGLRLRQTGLLGDRTCLIGSGALAAACLDEARAGANGASVLGYFDDEEADKRNPVSAIARLGSLNEAPSYIQRQRMDAVVIALPIEKHASIPRLVRELKRLPVRVLLAPWSLGPDQFRLMPRDGKPEIGKMVLVTLANPPLSGWRWIFKDLQDRTIAVLAVILCAPVLVAAALMIWLTDGRPILFRQLRHGYGGRAFEIYKFRTMYKAASAESGKDLKLTTRNDPRVFPVGRFLRRASLDELPQLFNVIRGDMWIVGPRPHPLFAKAAGKIYAEVVDDYPSRHRIKPGITGWAQVNGWRGPTDTLDQITNRVEHDLFYIENWSVLFDLRILFRTALCAFSHENAF